MLLPILSRPLQQCMDELRLSWLADLPAATSTVVSREAAWRAKGPTVTCLCCATKGMCYRSGPEPSICRCQNCWRLSITASTTGARPRAELNWRRFFDISSLIAIRVEEPDVFAATHGLLLGLVAEGLIDGLRIDHPDGLADPRGYLRQLATAASGSWIVAEKILAAGEELPGRLAVRWHDRLRRAGGHGRAVHRSALARATRRAYAEFYREPQDFASGGPGRPP